MENLIRAGAMDGLGRRWRDLLWELGGLAYQEDGLNVDVPIELASLPRLSEAERLGWEYELLGLAPGDHVMRLYREQLRAQGVLSSGELAEQRYGQVVRVAGLVVVRQRPPTAKGHVFITLEDEEGLVNLIVRPDAATQTKRLPCRHGYGLNDLTFILAEGIVQRNGNAVSVLATRIHPLSTDVISGVATALDAGQLPPGL